MTLVDSSLEARARPQPRGMVGPVRLAARFERWAQLLAALACLLVLSTWRHSPVVTLPQPKALPTVPAGTLKQNATLVVSLVALTTPSSAELPVGPPVPQGHLRVLWEREGQFYLAADVVTDRLGHVTVPHLPQGVVWLLAEAEGRARASRQLVLDEEPRSTTLGLLPARQLEVTVTDEQGVPLAAATVLARTTDPLPFGAPTGVDGKARLTRLGPAPYAVQAMARGFESVSRTGVSGPLTLVLRRLGALLVRIELPDGSNAAGAEVWVAGSSLWPARSFLTDQQGRAAVRGLLAGSFDLRATLGELATRTELGLSLGRGEERSVVLRLVPSRRVTVLVTEGDSEPPVPVANADVVATEGGLSSFPLRGRTGPDGRITLGPLPPGPATVTAAAEGFVGVGAVALPELLTGPLRLPLQRGATLVGRVVDVHGHPIPGASLEVVGTDFTGLPIAETPALRAYRQAHFAWALPGPQRLQPAGELGVMPGAIPPIPGAAAVTSEYILPLDTQGKKGFGLGNTGEIESWVSGTGGEFRAFPVTPGRVRALVRHPSFVEGQSALVTLAPGGRAEVEVVLHAGASLEGKVVDNWDRPIAGARLELTATKGTLNHTTYTADDGSFAFAALPDEISLTVERPDDVGHPALRRQVTLREGQRTTLRLVLGAPREPLEVKITDERGEPLDSAEVLVTSLQADTPLRLTRFTNAEGLLTLEDARGLPLEFRVELPGYVSLRQRVEAAPARVTLSLSRGVSVSGRVTTVRGRRPVEGATVNLVTQGVTRSTVTSSEGNWQLDDIAPGSVHLRVSAPELASTELDAEVKPTGRRDRAFELPAVDLPEPASVEGVVVDDKGAPVAGARVGLSPTEAFVPATSQTLGTTITDSQGHFTLKQAAPGRQTLHAYAAGVGRGHTAPLELSSGHEQSGLRITLSPTGIDEDPTGRLANVAITLGEGQGRVVIVSVASGSEAARAGLLPQDLLLSIEGRAVSGVSDARARLAGSESSDLLLELERAGTRLKIRVLREAVRR